MKYIVTVFLLFSSFGFSSTALQKELEVNESFIEGLRIIAQFEEELEKKVELTKESKEKLQDAALHLQKCIELDPFHSKSYYHLGRIRLVLGDFHGAKMCFSRVLIVEKYTQDDYWSTYYRAVCLNVLGKYNEALLEISLLERMNGPDISRDMEALNKLQSLRSKIRHIGIGLPIAEEPSHTTTHTDP